MLGRFQQFSDGFVPLQGDGEMGVAYVHENGCKSAAQD
jgi:hypothetical protein